MTRSTTGLIVLAALAALWHVTAHAQRDPQAEKAMAAAWQKANVEDETKRAIEQYQAIVSTYGKKDPANAAMALVMMGDLYRRSTGDAQARRLYERVAREFPTQQQAVALARARLGENVQAGRLTTRAVWTQPGTLRLHRLARDGRSVSYVGRGGLMVRDLVTNAERTISPQSGSASVFSPDGQRIAFVHDNSLRIANVSDAADPQPIFENRDSEYLFVHDWSPDGRYIAIADLQADGTEQIKLVSVAQGTSRVVGTIASRVDRRARRIYFSPDGKYLGYDGPQSSSNTNSDVFVVNVDGSNTRPAVVREDSHDRLVSWSPDGHWLLFTSDRSGPSSIWAIAWANGSVQGSPQRLASVPESFSPLGWTPSQALYYSTQFGGGPAMSQVRLASLEPDVTQYVSLPLEKRRSQEQTSNAVWSHDGRTLAYQSTVRERNAGALVILRSMETGRSRELKPDRVNLDRIVDWAPDGRSLFIEGRPHQQAYVDHRGVYRMDIESGTTRPLVGYPPNTGMNLEISSWWPDGMSFLTWFAAPGDPGPEGFGIYRVDAQTGAMTPVILDRVSALLDPRLSADGGTLYYRRMMPPVKNVYGPTTYVERNLATGRERELFRHTSYLPAIQLSADGQYIATIVAAGTDRTSSASLRLISTAGGQVRELMASGGRLDVPRWSPDSGAVFLWKRIGNAPAELWRVPLTGEPVRVEGDLPHSGAAIGAGLSVSPDGRHIAYTVTEPSLPATTDVVAIDNLLPKPVKR